MDYDEAEGAGRERQDRDGTPTLAQWARAEAIKAIMSGSRQPEGLHALETQTNILAQLIVTGSLPTPAPGVYY